MTRRHAMWLALAISLGAACADDVRVLGRQEVPETTPPTDDVPPGTGGDEPIPVGGAPPYVPCQTAMQDPTEICHCPANTSCFCELPESPCAVECPEGFCGIQCAFASVYCDAYCSMGCSLYCPEAAFCHLSCDLGCSALCEAGSYCEILGSVESPSYIYCEMGAQCVCLGEPSSCICDGPGSCETIM